MCLYEKKTTGIFTEFACIQRHNLNYSHINLRIFLDHVLVETQATLKDENHLIKSP